MLYSNCLWCYGVYCTKVFAKHNNKSNLQAFHRTKKKIVHINFLAFFYKYQLVIASNLEMSKYFWVFEIDKYLYVDVTVLPKSFYPPVKRIQLLKC